MKIYKSKYNTPEYRKKYTGIYGTWYSMKQRCTNPNNKQYSDYGGRGIIFPDKWKSFVGFKEDMQGGYKKGLTIERVDNNASYSKENCSWVTRKEQNNNKRSNIVITYKNKTLPLAYWADSIGLSFGTVRGRYYRGLPVEKILENRLMHRFGFRKI